MTDDQILYAHAADKKMSCNELSMLTYTSFLDLHQRSVIAPLEKEMNADTYTIYYGGYDGAERVIAVFVPSFFETQDPDELMTLVDNPITVLRADKDKFSNLNHRDYLGALMGLGIKRELLGDILADDKGCYIICMKQVAEYICKNLFSAGRGTLDCKEVSFDMLRSREENFEIINAFISSPRLDNFVAAAFDVSRSIAVQAIEKGIVFVDGVEVNKIDKYIQEGSKIVFRKKGKVIFDCIDGKSKKGRIHIRIKKYI